MGASRSIGQSTSMVETTSHTVDKLVPEEQTQGWKAHQASEAEALEMRQHARADVGAATKCCCGCTPETLE
eukprot:2888759-Prorocentrum_lima.AAC.1